MQVCQKCKGKKGIPEEGKKTCEPCLVYQREKMRQYHTRRKLGIVGPMGRPSNPISNEDIERYGYNANTQFSDQPLPSYEIGYPPIEPRLFSFGAAVLEKYMPSRMAEPLLVDILEAIFARAGTEIKKVAPPTQVDSQEESEDSD